MLSNAAALRLLLKTCALLQRVSLPTINTVILLGERVSTELYSAIDRVMKNSTKIAVCFLQHVKNVKFYNFKKSYYLFFDELNLCLK